jgi:lipid-A-disaccharide synthase
MKRKKIYIIATEESGDYISSKLIKSLRKETDGKYDLVFRAIGGSLTEAQDIKSLFSINKLNIMGIFEILPRIFEILKLIKITKQDIIDFKPDILITVDSPSFTFRVASAVKKLLPNTKFLHIVAPTVWAYKESRAKKYAEIYDHLFAILPFELEYFKKHNLKTNFVGHPILENKNNFKFSNSSYFLKEKSETKTILVTPGSRFNEIKRHMKTIIESLNSISFYYSIDVIYY